LFEEKEKNMSQDEKTGDEAFASAKAFFEKMRAGGTATVTATVTAAELERHHKVIEDRFESWQKKWDDDFNALDTWPQSSEAAKAALKWPVSDTCPDHPEAESSVQPEWPSQPAISLCEECEHEFVTPENLVDWFRQIDEYHSP
jgi:hypothetical protein